MRSAVRKFAVVAGVVVAATLVAVPGAEAAPVTTCPGTELHKEGLPKPLKNQLGEQAGDPAPVVLQRERRHQLREGLRRRVRVALHVGQHPDGHLRHGDRLRHVLHLRRMEWW